MPTAVWNPSAQTSAPQLPSPTMVPQVPFPASSVQATPPQSPAPTSQNTPSPVSAIQQAIGHFESQGNYNAIGKQTASGDRAYGKYQVMGSNIPSWTKAATGTAMTPQQFLQSPQAQDAVASYQMGKLYTQYKNPADVASAWFSGKPLAAAGNEQDVNGTTVPAYVEAILKLLGGGTAYAATLPQSSGSSPSSAASPSAQPSQSGTPQYPGMPPMAHFSLPTPGQASTAPAASTGQQQPQYPGMPPMAQFSLPASPGGASQSQQPGSESFVDPGSPASQVANPNNNPMQAATNLTNALGLGGTTNTFGQDIASLANPSLAQKGLLPLPTAEQNLGAIAQTGAIAATPFIGPEGVMANIGAGAGLGAAQMGGQAMTQNASAQQVAQQGTMGALLGGAASGAASGMSKLLGTLGDKISFGVIKPNAADIKDGFNIKTVNDNNLNGTLNQTLTKTKALMNDLTSQLASKLQGSTSGIDLADVFDKTTNDLTSQQGKLAGFGQNAATGRVLQQLQDEVLSTNPTGQLSIPDAQVVKQATGGMGAWQYGSADPDANAKETVYNTFYRNLKTEIENSSPAGVKEINQKLSDLIPVMNAVIRRIPIAERNSAISLADMVGLVGSVINPAAAIPTAANMAAHSGVVGGLLSKMAPSLQQIAPAAGMSAGLMSSLIGSQASRL